MLKMVLYDTDILWYDILIIKMIYYDAIIILVTQMISYGTDGITHNKWMRSKYYFFEYYLLTQRLSYNILK